VNISHLKPRSEKFDDDDDDDDDNNNNNNNKCMKREMSQCCGIKQYTQTEKLQQIGQIQ
jgi:hypothetical protein